MNTRLLSVDPRRPDSGALDEVRRCLLTGGIIAFPTESFYGLGVMASSASAIERLFALKRRPADQPVPVVVADRRQVATVIEAVPPAADLLMARFWPGPLTLVMPARASLPGRLTGGTGKLGVRQPGLPLPALVAAASGPITATSANRTGAMPATTAQMVRDSFGDEIDLILDGGPTPGGPASTVLDVTIEPPRLVRAGRITEEQLVTVCSRLQGAGDDGG